MIKKSAPSQTIQNDQSGETARLHGTPDGTLGGQPGTAPTDTAKPKTPKTIGRKKTKGQAQPGQTEDAAEDAVSATADAAVLLAMAPTDTPLPVDSF